MRDTIDEDAANAVRFREFRRLWAEYREAFARPFAPDRDRDEQIKAEVARCYEALNNLAKEG